MTHPIIFPMRRRGATGLTGAGVSTLEPRIAEVENPAESQTVFVSSTSGNDSNHGTVRSPVKTATGVFNKLKANRKNTICLMSDLVWDIRQTFLVPMNITFQRHAQSTNPELRFVNATNNPVSVAGFKTESWLNVSFLQMNVILDSSRNNESAFLAQPGTIKSWFWSSSFEAIGSDTSRLYKNSHGGDLNVYFQDTPMTNAAGRLFTDVSSGADPNARQGIITNITSG